MLLIYYIDNNIGKPSAKPVKSHLTVRINHGYINCLFCYIDNIGKPVARNMSTCRLTNVINRG